MVDLPNESIDVSSMTQNYDRPSDNVHIYKLDAVHSHSAHGQPVPYENNTFGRKWRTRMFVWFSLISNFHVSIDYERLCCPNFYRTYYK